MFNDLSISAIFFICLHKNNCQVHCKEPSHRINEALHESLVTDTSVLPVDDYNVRCNPAGIRYFARWKNCKWRLPEHPCCPQSKDKSKKIKKLSFRK